MQSRLVNLLSRLLPQVCEIVQQQRREFSEWNGPTKRARSEATTNNRECCPSATYHPCDEGPRLRVPRGDDDCDGAESDEHQSCGRRDGRTDYRLDEFFAKFAQIQVHHANIGGRVLLEDLQGISRTSQPREESNTGNVAAHSAIQVLSLGGIETTAVRQAVF